MGLPLSPVVATAQATSSSRMLRGLLSNPWFYAMLSTASMAVGSATGIWVAPAKKWQAVLLAVGGGSLVVSLAFELYHPAVRNIGRYVGLVYFSGGVLTFGGLDILIDRHVSSRTEENGLGLWVSVTTDGIPENAVMGSLLTGNPQGHSRSSSPSSSRTARSR